MCAETTHLLYATSGVVVWISWDSVLAEPKFSQGPQQGSAIKGGLTKQGSVNSAESQIPLLNTPCRKLDLNKDAPYLPAVEKPLGKKYTFLGFMVI